MGDIGRLSVYIVKPFDRVHDKLRSVSRENAKSEYRNQKQIWITETQNSKRRKPISSRQKEEGRRQRTEDRLSSYQKIRVLVTLCPPQQAGYQDSRGTVYQENGWFRTGRLELRMDFALKPALAVAEGPNGCGMTKRCWKGIWGGMCNLRDFTWRGSS